MPKTLCDLSLGESGVIESIRPDSPICDRLMQLGFLSGERVCRGYTDGKAFLSAYRIGNTWIALRRTDASAVLIRA